MSSYTNAAGTPKHDHPAVAGTDDPESGRMRRWLSRVVAIAVLAWSAVELISLGLSHTTGPELYGVLVAALAVVAGILTAIGLMSTERRFWMSVAALTLWAVVAIGGVAGTVAHVVGPAPGHGPIDARERPFGAPLIFTGLGLVGGAALVYGQRMRIRLPLNG